MVKETEALDLRGIDAIRGGDPRTTGRAPRSGRRDGGAGRARRVGPARPDDARQLGEPELGRVPDRRVEHLGPPSMVDRPSRHGCLLARLTFLARPYYLLS